MEINNIGSTQFFDATSGELSYIVVRVVNHSIGIGVAQRLSGEAEVFFDTEKCELLIGWLNDALALAKNPTQE